MPNGRFMYLDIEDKPLYLSREWSMLGGLYLRALDNGVAFHRWLMGITDQDVQVYHVNGNELDNRRFNLRVGSRK